MPRRRRTPCFSSFRSLPSFRWPRLSSATESVAAKTGDSIGGLLNASLGNLTELVIALTALRMGMFELVKASIAGAIVANLLFMLGISFLLGGLRHHVQEYNAASARLQIAMVLLATVTLLVPSALAGAAQFEGTSFVQDLASPSPSCSPRSTRSGCSSPSAPTARCSAPGRTRRARKRPGLCPRP